MSHPIVRRLTAAALFLVLASAAPALAAPGPASGHRSPAPRVPIVTRVTLLDKLLDWLGVSAAGHLPEARGRFEKGETGQSTLIDNVLELLTPTEDRGAMIDPNG